MVFISPAIQLLDCKLARRGFYARLPVCTRYSLQPCTQLVVILGLVSPGWLDVPNLGSFLCLAAVRTCSLQIKTVVPRTWSTSCPHHQHHYFHHNQQQQPQQQRTRLPTWGSANSFTPVLIQWNGKNASRVAAAAASANGSL